MKGLQIIVKLLPLLLLAVAIATWSGQAVMTVNGNTNMVHKGALLCVASELYPCMPSLTTSMAPSRMCCQKLREQQPCFCEYLKSPTFRPYVHGYRTEQICKSCGVPFPTSC